LVELSAAEFSEFSLIKVNKETDEK